MMDKEIRILPSTNPKLPLSESVTKSYLAKFKNDSAQSFHFSISLEVNAFHTYII